MLCALGARVYRKLILKAAYDLTHGLWAPGNVFLSQHTPNDWADWTDQLKKLCIFCKTFSIHFCHQSLFAFISFVCFRINYRIVESASPSHFEAHVGLFRLLVKGIFDPYVLGPFDFLISKTRISTCDFTVIEEMTKTNDSKHPSYMGAIKATSKMHWCIALVAFPSEWKGPTETERWYPLFPKKEQLYILGRRKIEYSKPRILQEYFMKIV